MHASVQYTQLTDYFFLIRIYVGQAHTRYSLFITNLHLLKHNSDMLVLLLSGAVAIGRAYATHLVCCNRRMMQLWYLSRSDRFGRVYSSIIVAFRTINSRLGLACLQYVECRIEQADIQTACLFLKELLHGVPHAAYMQSRLKIKRSAHKSYFFGPKNMQDQFGGSQESKKNRE